MNIDELKSQVDSIVNEVWKMLPNRAIKLDDEEVWELEELIISHMAKYGMLTKR